MCKKCERNEIVLFYAIIGFFSSPRYFQSVEWFSLLPYPHYNGVSLTSQCLGEAGRSIVGRSVQYSYRAV